MRYRRELCPGDNIRNRIETVNSSAHSYHSPVSLSPQQMITESSSFLQLRTRDDNTLLPQETGSVQLLDYTQTTIKIQKLLPSVYYNNSV
jgi:hypothetical protein